MMSASDKRAKWRYTHAHERLGLTAASFRMMKHSTLDMPISGPSMCLAIVDMHPTATRMKVPMVPIGTRKAAYGGGSAMDMS
jgi:hypothetical protein